MLICVFLTDINLGMRSTFQPARQLLAILSPVSTSSLARYAVGFLMMLAMHPSRSATAEPLNLPNENAQQYQRQLERARQLEQQQQPTTDVREAGAQLRNPLCSPQK